MFAVILTMQVMFILISAAVNEAWQVDTTAESIIKLSDLTFIPPYEADGVAGTGVSNSLDAIEMYCKGAGTVYKLLVQLYIYRLFGTWCTCRPISSGYPRSY